MCLKYQDMPFSLEIGSGRVLFFSPFQAMTVLNSVTHVLGIHPRGHCRPSHPDPSVPPSPTLLVSLGALEVPGSSLQPPGRAPSLRDVSQRDKGARAVRGVAPGSQNESAARSLQNLLKI